jgi:hypothetical protein
MDGEVGEGVLKEFTSLRYQLTITTKDALGDPMRWKKVKLAQLPTNPNNPTKK